MIKKLINQGRTAEIYDIGDNKIVKLYKNNFPQQAIEKEYNISRLITKTDLPVPKFIKKTKIDKRVGLIFEKITGEPLLNKLLKKPWMIFYYAKKMAEVHTLINSKTINGIPSYKTILKYYIKKTSEISEDIKNKIIKFSSKLNSKNNLCHGDIHPDNILISKGNYFIIDWILASAGSPCADVARTLVILLHSGISNDMSFFRKVIVFLFKNLLCKKYLKHYIKLTGISKSEINKWKLPIAAARLSENGPMEEKKELKKLIFKELKKYN